MSNELTEEDKAKLQEAAEAMGDMDNTIELPRHMDIDEFIAWCRTPLDPTDV